MVRIKLKPKKRNAPEPNEGPVLQAEEGALQEEYKNGPTSPKQCRGDSNDADAAADREVKRSVTPERNNVEVFDLKTSPPNTDQSSVSVGDYSVVTIPDENASNIARHNELGMPIRYYFENDSDEGLFPPAMDEVEANIQSESVPWEDGMQNEELVLQPNELALQEEYMNGHPSAYHWGWNSVDDDAAMDREIERSVLAERIFVQLIYLRNIPLILDRNPDEDASIRYYVEPYVDDSDAEEGLFPPAMNEEQAELPDLVAMMQMEPPRRKG